MCCPPPTLPSKIISPFPPSLSLPSANVTSIVLLAWAKTLGCYLIPLFLCELHPHTKDSCRLYFQSYPDGSNNFSMTVTTWAYDANSIHLDYSNILLTVPFCACRLHSIAASWNGILITSQSFEAPQHLPWLPSHWVKVYTVTIFSLPPPLLLTLPSHLPALGHSSPLLKDTNHTPAVGFLPELFLAQVSTCLAPLLQPSAQWDTSHRVLQGWEERALQASKSTWKPSKNSRETMKTTVWLWFSG